LLRSAFWIVFILLSRTSTVLAAEAPKTVLAIYSNRNDLAGNVIVEATFRSVLTLGTRPPVDLRTEYINTIALSEDARHALTEFMRTKYAKEQIDVVVAIGQDAIRFVRDYGQKLFPGIPIVIWGGRDLVTDWSDGPPFTGVLEPEGENHYRKALDFILRMQPKVQKVFIVSGASDGDRRRELMARNALGGYRDHVDLVYLAGLPLDDLLQRLAHVPAEAAILFLIVSEDGTGRKLMTPSVLEQATPISNAPVYSLSAAHLGTGIVGGPVTNHEGMTREAAEIVQRLLRGEKIQDIPLQDSYPVPMVDWRQLRHWNIQESRLPGDSVVLYKPPSVWTLYKWHIIIVSLLCLVQSALILALLFHRAKRKRAEKDVIRSRELLQSTIDALDARIGLLDENANIIATNESWRQFAKTPAGSEPGGNYLDICKTSPECEEPLLVIDGIRSLLGSESSSFCCVYKCNHGGVESWFQLRAARFMSQGVPRLAITHEDVTEIKRAHEIQQQHAVLLLQAQDDERRRIARDLHDVTVQNLAAIRADLLLSERTSDDTKALLEGVALCDQVIDELRTLSYLLHPPLLDEAGLAIALQTFVRGFVKRSAINAELVVLEDIGRLPADTETALFRVVQESLANVHRHSGARSAVVWLTHENGEAVIRIQDDGRGITAMSADKPGTGQLVGVGILGMRQRVRQLGGRLEIESDSHGTTVTARVPAPSGGYHCAFS
jgi:signal transduction histidine kinase